MQERSNDNLENSYTLIEYPLLAKYHINDKFSVLFGPKINVLKENGNINLDDISLFSKFGFQYDITEDFSVEGRGYYNVFQKPASNTINYTTDDFVIYKIGAKLKF